MNLISSMRENSHANEKKKDVKKESEGEPKLLARFF